MTSSSANARVAGSIRFVANDPGSGRFFQLGEAEYFISRQLDGHTSLEEVSRRAEQRFGAALGVDVVLSATRASIHRTPWMLSGAIRSSSTRGERGADLDERARHRDVRCSMLRQCCLSPEVPMTNLSGLNI